MRFAINFLLGVLLCMTLLLSVSVSASEACEFGVKPDGSCKNACEYLHGRGAMRTLRWDAYIWGQDPKQGCIGDNLELRCRVIASGSQVCVGVGANGSTIVGTSCSGRWKYSGETCSDAEFSGGTIPSTPDPDPDPPKPPVPDESILQVPNLTVTGFSSLGSQIRAGDKAIQSQIRSDMHRSNVLGTMQTKYALDYYSNSTRLMVDTGSTIGLVADGVSALNQTLATQKQTPWTEKTLKELIDGISILSDCTKDGKIIDPTTGAETPCVGSGSGGNSGSGDNGSGNGTNNDLLSQINDATGLTAGRVFGLQRSNEMNLEWIGETLEGMRYSDKTFTKPAKPEFKTPFKDGVEGLKTEITQLEKDIETKLSQSPLKMGTMNFSSGSYKGTQFDLDHHGHRISVGFNLLNTLAPHIDLIKGVIIFIATLTVAFIVLSSGRNS
ncbi:hypothetical protein [Vibrio tubiashii]|uniref:hypothetical protein n=1 Tax=Vibrio tubiashii TaxID=29498 RepID=UPI00349E8514